MKGHKEPLGKNKWKLVLELGKDASGRRVRSTPVFYGTGSAADAEIVKQLNKIENGTFADPSRITVAEYLQQWLEDYAKIALRSQRTYDRYEDIIRNHLSPNLGRFRLSKLRSTHIQSYYARALEGGRVQRPRKPRPEQKGRKKKEKKEKPPRLKHLSPQTVKNHHAVLHRALKQAVRWNLLAVNPADAVEPPRPQPKDIHVLDAEGSVELLESLDGTEFYVPAAISLGTGMRLGEILGLRWQDVDLKSGRISVRQNLQETRAGLVFKGPKTAKGRRSISLLPETVELLKQHKRKQATSRLARGAQYEDRGLVICGADGSPWSPNNLSAQWRRRVRMKWGVTFHDLRHTHATLLLAQNTHAKIVSERLGHSTIGITMDTYSHVLPSMQDEAALTLQEAFATARAAVSKASR